MDLDELERLAKSAVEGWQAPEVVRALVGKIPALVARVRELEAEREHVLNNSASTTEKLYERLDSSKLKFDALVAMADAAIARAEQAERERDAAFRFRSGVDETRARLAEVTAQAAAYRRALAEARARLIPRSDGDGLDAETRVTQALAVCDVTLAEGPPHTCSAGHLPGTRIGKEWCRGCQDVAPDAGRALLDELAALREVAEAARAAAARGCSICTPCAGAEAGRLSGAVRESLAKLDALKAGR